MDAEKLLNEVSERLGDGGSFTLESNVHTKDGMRLRVTWIREGFEGQKRSADGWNLVEIFRKILLYEDEVDEAKGAIGFNPPGYEG